MADENTRESLLRTAETLFAERGIGAVSLRQIQAAASQRNKSVVQYHFGNKRGLIEAIFQDRMRENDRRRVELLDAMPAPGVRDLLRALVYPFAEQLDDPTRGHYIRFVAQVVRAPDLWLEGEAQARSAAPGLVRVFEGLRAALPHLPEAIRNQRLVQVTRQQIHALADREQELRSAPAGRRPPGSHALFVSNLVDMMAASLEAPVSPETRDEIESTAASA